MKNMNTFMIVIDAEDEVLTYMSCPQRHWQQIFFSNVLERLNKCHHHLY